jgi:hypothetical protein
MGSRIRRGCQCDVSPVVPHGEGGSRFVSVVMRSLEDDYAVAPGDATPPVSPDLTDALAAFDLDVVKARPPGP